MEVLKNFKILEDRWEEFPHIKVLPGEDVFVGLPICKMDFQATFKKPVVMMDNSIPTVVELEELQHKLANTKRFYLVADEKGFIKEVEPKDSQITIRLPKDTNISELVYINGQILKQEVKD